VALNVKVLDRYVIRETLAPFTMALGLFTFLMAVRPMLDNARNLLAKGVDIGTVGYLLLLLMPQALGITIPMAFMAGLLMGLGRLSGDREMVALLACGVSPLRLLRPVLLMALITGGTNLYMLVRLVPDWNQRFRETTYQLLVQQGESDIKPGVFYEGFPGKVLLVGARKPGAGGWSNVILADTSQPGRPALVMADSGYLDLDPEKRQVAIVLPGESIRYLPGDEDVPGEAAGTYDMAQARDLRFAVPADSVFGDGSILVRGRAEMTIADLRKAERERRAAGLSPHNEIMQRHQMFSFPAACLVFALVGIALGLHTRKEGKLGGFTLGLGVIVVYYAVMATFENMTKGGDFPAEWARWMPNLIVGLVGVVALRWRMRGSDRELTFRLPAWGWRRPKTAPARSTATSAPAVRPVVVIRIPQFDSPVRTLDRYVARRYATVAVLSLVSLLALYYIGTLVDKSERVFKGEATGWMLLQYFYYSTPQFIAYIVPMATLVAALATIGGLTRTSELTVMRACGVSLYRTAVPLVLLSLVWSGGLFLIDDRVLAEANRAAERLEDRIKGNLPHTMDTLANANWLVDRDGRIYYYSAFDIRRKTLYGLSVFEPAGDGNRLASHTLAARAVYGNDGWRAYAGWVQRFPAPQRSVREPFRERRLALAPPDQFSGMHNRETDLMTFSEMRRHLANQSRLGMSLADVQVQLQSRIAFPFVAVVMTILGVAFGVTTGRRGALYGIGLALILGAAYWLVNTIFLAAGQADLLPAALAAWGANVLFLAIAVYGTLTVRT
jgi:LPS export ABC transporter permease LptG/LPS export ABC transporter permease LptF